MLRACGLEGEFLYDGYGALKRYDSLRVTRNVTMKGDYWRDERRLEQSGFSGAGGIRSSQDGGGYQGLGNRGMWWASTGIDAGSEGSAAWSRGLWPVLRMLLATFLGCLSMGEKGYLSVALRTLNDRAPPMPSPCDLPLAQPLALQAQCGSPDTNCDEVVNVSDVLVLLSYFGTIESGNWTESEDCSSPDVNCDGNVNVEDLLGLLSYFGQSDADSDGIWDSEDDCVCALAGYRQFCLQL